MNQRLKNIGISICYVLCCIIMCACSSGTVLSEKNGETSLSMDVSKYTDKLERTMTIKNSQSGRFLVEMNPCEGKITVTIMDQEGNTILTRNEKATTVKGASITTVEKGNGTYKVMVTLKNYSGTFDISWDIKGQESGE